MFLLILAAILVHQDGAPIWRSHTKLYKGAWNVSANNSETVGHKDLRLVYILVFYSMSFPWLLSPDDFQFNFLLRDSENDLYRAPTDKLTKVVNYLTTLQNLFLFMNWRCWVCKFTESWFCTSKSSKIFRILLVGRRANLFSSTNSLNR